MENYLIVKTKITPPKLGKNILKRQRLLDLLRDNLDKKLVLISADAGYGKTTLISDLASEIEQHRKAWHTIDKGDADFVVFMSYLVESISQAYPNFGNKTKIVIKNIKEISPNIEILVGTFINELIDTLKDELFVFIDDYQEVSESKPINDALNYLIEHQPQKLHLIISTRTLPTIQLAKLTAKQQLFALKKEELQFTEEEVKALFNDIYHTEVPEVELSKIEEYTKGWITALQLILQELSYKKTDEVIDVYSKAGKRAFEYFGNEIIQKLPEKLQSFLFKSSILESMDPRLLNNLLEINNSDETLNSLMELNLFVSTVPGEKDVYKYHPLFRDFLMNQLNKIFGKELIKDLYQKAATYFARVGDIESAISYWLASECWKEAAALIEKVAGDRLNKGRIDTVNNWINSLPQDLVDNHPWLLAYKGEILYRWGEWDDALQMFEKAKKIFEKRDNKLGLSYSLSWIGTIAINRGDASEGLKIEKDAMYLIQEEEHLLKAEILSEMSRALRRMGEYKEAIRNLTRALSLCKKIENLPLQTKILHNMGAIYYCQGDFTRVDRSYKEIIEIYSKTPFLWTGTAYNNMAELSLMKGDYPQCKTWLEKGIKTCKDFNDKGGLAHAYLVMGEMLGETEEYESAMKKYQEALTLNLELKDKETESECLEGIAKLYLLQGDYYRAEQYINKTLKAVEKSDKSLRFAQVLMTQSEIEIATGAFEKAESTLLKSLHIIENLDANYDLMQVYFWLAQLYLKKALPSVIARSKTTKQSQEEQRLMHYMKKTLSIARKHGYDYFLIKNCRHNPSFLDFAVRNKIEPRYAIFILSQIGPPVFDTLTSLFEIKDESIQRWVIEGLVHLGRIGDEQTLHWLEKCRGLINQTPTIGKQALKENISSAINRLKKVKRAPKEVVYAPEKEVKYRFKDIIGEHPKMQELYSILDKVIDTDATVLITGETGTGKELVAGAIHYNGKRKNNKFIALACGALPETLLESELFGYVKGAFTGAVSTKKGLFEEADGGTLFLDDVANLTPGIQAKLLRVLEDKEIRPVGGVSSKKVNVRIIASTNKELEKEVKEGRFREDLYYRLAVVKIELPSLRERKSDIPLLAQHFLKKYSTQIGKEIKGFEKEVIDLLLAYNWPGNVRELEHEIERAVVLCRDNIIRADNLRIATPVKEEIMSEEQRMIINAIAKTGGNKTKAAKIIGWSRWKLYRRMKALNLH
ncbi:MAG: sigma 54-interacting transcriptional regulator [bacterium]|nr:sigma 54-interacting transcriptional regulator [bacterium]